MRRHGELPAAWGGWMALPRISRTLISSSRTSFVTNGAVWEEAEIASSCAITGKPCEARRGAYRSVPGAAQPALARQGVWKLAGRDWLAISGSLRYRGRRTKRLEVRCTAHLDRDMTLGSARPQGAKWSRIRIIGPPPLCARASVALALMTGQCSLNAAIRSFGQNVFAPRQSCKASMLTRHRTEIFSSVSIQNWTPTYFSYRA